MFHYKLQQNDKKHLKKWGICFNFNYNETTRKWAKKDKKSKPPILKQTKMGVNLKLYFELNDIMSRKLE